MTVDAWLDARTPTRVVHLDVAGAGRPSREVLDAEIAHLHREAALGAYVAAELAEEVVDEGRAALAALVGLAGADVCFLDGAGHRLRHAARRLAAAGRRAGRHPAERVRRERPGAAPAGRRARLGAGPAAGRRRRPDHRRAGRPGPGHLPAGAEPARDRPAGRAGAGRRHAAAARRGAVARAGAGARGLRGVRRDQPQVAVRARAASASPSSPRGAGDADRAAHAGPAHGTGHAALGGAGGARRRRVGLRRGRAAVGSPGLLGLVRDRAAPGAQRAGRRRGLAGARAGGRADRASRPSSAATPSPPGPGCWRTASSPSAIGTSRSDDLDAPVLRVSTAGWVAPAELDALAEALAARTK
jgi:hypothetical protein